MIRLLKRFAIAMLLHACERCTLYMRS